MDLILKVTLVSNVNMLLFFLQTPPSHHFPSIEDLHAKAQEVARDIGKLEKSVSPSATPKQLSEALYWTCVEVKPDDWQPMPVSSDALYWICM